MEKIINTEQIPIKMWLTEIEEGALQQTKNLANHPFAFHHIAIMSDAHVGYGMPIGGVMATEDVIIPNAVGVDIGCGMCAVKTSKKQIDNNTLKKIMSGIRARVPLGFKHHKQKQAEHRMPRGPEGTEIVKREYQKALKQIGTLGGGNHFIEIQKGDDGYIWLMVHSGSRNIGLQVAEHYNKVAKRNRGKYKSKVPIKWQLDYLPVDSKEGMKYYDEMKFCVNFALGNRKLMMERIKEIFSEETGGCDFDELINIAHNYAANENHFGKSVWVHRKGATQAKMDQLGIIPGSQGANSYIVKGKGNPESFRSCSHGSGRKMGRREARRKLNLSREVKKLEEKGVLHSIRGSRDLDEAPGAYKNISMVMKQQKDLVEILVELEPLAVIKG
ncbi:RtcB family protein [Candidatus Dojkabacteria bacterium]|nr:RtcB family protein [Candidatus Dojkabacteria bacterium]